MIDIKDYFGPWIDCEDATPERRANAEILLERVNNLLLESAASGIQVRVNPATKTEVSGATLGGFRPQNCGQGSPHSAHKEGMAVDVYDPNNAIDDWLTDEILESYDLYREDPSTTDKWCHLSIRKPGSGHRTFMP